MWKRHNSHSGMRWTIKNDTIIYSRTRARGHFIEFLGGSVLTSEKKSTNKDEIDCIVLTVKCLYK